MQNVVRIPADVEQLPPFVALSVKVGRREALCIWWELFKQLTYRAQEGSAPGRLAKSEGPALEASFLELLGRAGPILPWLIEVKLLREDGEDYVCPRFAMLHGEMGAVRTPAQRGADMKAFNARQRRASEQAFQQALSIAESKLVDAEGEPLPSETVRRVTRLVVGVDNALFKEPRPQFAYTEGLIQSALATLRKFSDDEIDALLKTLVAHRSHPLLNGMTTEKLLPVIAEKVGELEK